MLSERWWRWCGLSGALFAVIVGEALCAAAGRRSGFETFMAIASSKPRLMVVCNALLAASVSIAACVASLMFGTLRRTEYEYLAERCRVGLVEFFLTLAMFRHTMTWQFGVAVFLLLTAKVFHWMARGRVQWLSADLSLQRPSSWMHLQNTGALLLLAGADAAALHHAWGGGALAWPPPAASLLFIFHYAALAVSLVVTIAEYVLSAAPDQCYGKGSASLVVGLVGDTLQLLVYAGLLAAVWALHNTPPFLLLTQVGHVTPTPTVHAFMSTLPAGRKETLWFASAQVLDGVEQVWTKATALHRFWQLIDESSHFMVDVPPPPVGADGESDLCVVCRYVCALTLCYASRHCIASRRSSTINY